MLEDSILIWRFKRGSKEALCRIYEKYESDLLTLAANLLSEPSTAEDVLQEVFVRFVESIDKFELRGSLKAYLATCVANRCRDCIRKNQRHKTIAIDEAAQTVSDGNTPVQLVINSEELQRVSRALAELPYEQREVVVLHLHGDLKFKAIAELQEATIKTVQSRYRYGLNKLRSILNGEVNPVRKSTKNGVTMQHKYNPKRDF
jgi:RNA polymerase sigma-70 factor (ECF subfamily)